MLTSPPASEALTFASSPTSTLPVAWISPCTVPPRWTSPSMWSSPINRSRGPRVTWLLCPEAGVSGGGGSAVDLGTLAPGALVLKVAHADMPVHAGAVFDLQPARRYVAGQLCPPAQEKLVPDVGRSFDVPLDGDVGRLEQGLHLGSRRNLDVARHAKLTFGAPVDVDGAVVCELAFQAVIRPHRELALPIALLILGSLDGAFCDCLLYVH